MQSGDGPIVLVLTPTRELAVQIQAECTKFASKCQITTAACYGGVARDDQIAQLEEGVEILIATPGRLIDFLDTNVTNMRRVTYLVLDEADRMLVTSNPALTACCLLAKFTVVCLILGHGLRRAA